MVDDSRKSVPVPRIRAVGHRGDETVRSAGVGELGIRGVGVGAVFGDLDSSLGWVADCVGQHIAVDVSAAEVAGHDGLYRIRGGGGQTQRRMRIVERVVDSPDPDPDTGDEVADRHRRARHPRVKRTESDPAEHVGDDRPSSHRSGDLRRVGQPQPRDQRVDAPGCGGCRSDGGNGGRGDRLRRMCVSGAHGLGR